MKQVVKFPGEAAAANQSIGINGIDGGDPYWEMKMDSSRERGREGRTRTDTARAQTDRSDRPTKCDYSSAGDRGLMTILAEQERGNLPVFLQEGGK